MAHHILHQRLAVMEKVDEDSPARNGAGAGKARGTVCWGRAARVLHDLRAPLEVRVPAAAASTRRSARVSLACEQQPDGLCDCGKTCALTGRSPAAAP
eukprot:COSAG03_NODE_1747_length_3571_cov_4.212846_5_plen_98_part_00